MGRRFLIRVRIHLCFQGLVLHLRAVQLLHPVEDPVEEEDNTVRTLPLQISSHGNYPEMPLESGPSSMQYGQKKVHGEYGKVPTFLL